MGVAGASGGGGSLGVAGVAVGTSPGDAAAAPGEGGGFFASRMAAVVVMMDLLRQTSFRAESLSDRQAVADASGSERNILAPRVNRLRLVLAPPPAAPRTAGACLRPRSSTSVRRARRL